MENTNAVKEDKRLNLERKKSGRIIRYIFKFLFLFFVTYTIYSTLVIFIFRWVNPHTTSFINSKSNSNISSYFDAVTYSQNWTPINKISSNIFLAVIASEDQLFFDHYGFDLKQIEKALDENESRRRIRGASTLTQQLSKNLFLWNSKSIFRKGIEAYYTVLIELLWSKERILEVYLNICEFGDDIYGVEAAASHFFHKSALRLNSVESAYLAAVLPNPLRRNINNPSNYLINRKDRIIRQMKLMGGTEFIKNRL